MTILVANPDDCDRRLLSYVLTQEGFTVCEAGSAAVAMQLADREDVALAILADEYCNRDTVKMWALGDNGRSKKSIPILLFGRSLTKQEIHRALGWGVAATLVRKGFRVDRFIEMVREAICHRGPSRSETDGKGSPEGMDRDRLLSPPSANPSEMATIAGRNVPPAVLSAACADERHRKIQELIAATDNLSISASVPLRMLQLKRDPSANIHQFAEAASTDSVLCAKIIAIANSAWFSPVRPITKLSEAISAIGLKRLFPLALSLSMAGLYSRLRIPKELDGQFRASSLLKAIAAREYALRRTPDQAEEAYLCGLLQDVAVPFIIVADPKLWPLLNRALNLDHAFRMEVEQSLYGADHAEVGRQLVRKIGMPELYQSATAAHHAGDGLAAAVREPGLASALAFAAAIPHHVADWKWTNGEQVGSLPMTPEIADSSGIDAIELLSEVRHRHNEMQAMLALDTAGGNGRQGLCEPDDSRSTLEVFMQEVSGELAREVESLVEQSKSRETTLESRQADLEQSLKNLKKKADLSDHDELTTLLNRRGFLSAAQRTLGSACEHRQECVIGFVDVDNLKAINDRYGHDSGDVVIKTVSDVLRSSLRESDVVGRLGGDEFAFVVTAEYEDQARQIIQRISESQQVETLTNRKENVAATFSMGLLWLGIPGPSHVVQKVLAEADRLMYQAKRSGKARCIIESRTRS